MTQARYMVGATAAEGGVQTTTINVDPFSLGQSRERADTWAKQNANYFGTIVTLRPTADNKDVNVHTEVFDIDAEEPDPSSSRYATEAEAQAAVTARMSSLKANMAPYSYVASYGGANRLDEKFSPPELKKTVTTTQIAAGGLFLGVVSLGLVASLKGRKRHHA